MRMRSMRAGSGAVNGVYVSNSAAHKHAATSSSARHVALDINHLAERRRVRIRRSSGLIIRMQQNSTAIRQVLIPCCTP